MVIVVDWTDFLVKLLAIMGLCVVAGILLGFGVLGLIMRYEYRQRRKRRREARACQAQAKALWKEVDRILAENRGI